MQWGHGACVKSERPHRGSSSRAMVRASIRIGVGSSVLVDLRSRRVQLRDDVDVSFLQTKALFRPEFRISSRSRPRDVPPRLSQPHVECETVDRWESRTRYTGWM